MRKITKGLGQDDITFIFLIEDTAKGAGMSDAQRKREIGAVNKAVQRAGGECRLFETRGSAFEYVSVISGISGAAAIRIAREIDKTGNVKATLMPGLELFSDA